MENQTKIEKLAGYLIFLGVLAIVCVGMLVLQQCAGLSNSGFSGIAD